MIASRAAAAAPERRTQRPRGYPFGPSLNQIFDRSWLMK